MTTTKSNSSTGEQDATINLILDHLFTKGSNETGDRLLLIQEDYNGAAQVSNARYLGGYSRLPIRDILRDALQHREQEVRERMVRVLGVKEVEDLAHHAVGVWQAFEESHLFNNTPENGQRIRGAVDDARDIASIAAAIRRDDTPQEGEGS